MPMNHDENPLKINEEYLSFIGSATAIWSELDITLQILIWKLLELDEDKGLAVTNHMTFNNKIHLAKTLVSIWFDGKKISNDNRELLLEDIKWVNNLSEYRNKIMHGYFFVNEGDAHIQHVAARGKINRTMHFKTLDDFRYFINSANCVSYNLYQSVESNWMNPPKGERKPLPDRLT